jgi:hypothetical protein
VDREPSAHLTAKPSHICRGKHRSNQRISHRQERRHVADCRWSDGSDDP